MHLPALALLAPDLLDSDKAAEPLLLYGYFSDHPAVKAFEQTIKVNAVKVDLAKQNYKPEWTVNAAYGYRDNAPGNGGERADLFSLGVAFDLPVFTENRQDKQLVAAELEVLSAKAEKVNIIREFIGAFITNKAKLKSLQERRTLYEVRLLPEIKNQSEVSLSAYTIDFGSFAEAVRDKISELNAFLDLLAIQTEEQKTIMALNYLFIKEAGDLIARKDEKIAPTLAMNNKKH